MNATSIWAHRQRCLPALVIGACLGESSRSSTLVAAELRDRNAAIITNASNATGDVELVKALKPRSGNPQHSPFYLGAMKQQPRSF